MNHKNRFFGWTVTRQQPWDKATPYIEIVQGDYEQSSPGHLGCVYFLEKQSEGTFTTLTDALDHAVELYALWYADNPYIGMGVGTTLDGLTEMEYHVWFEPRDDREADYPGVCFGEIPIFQWYAKAAELDAELERCDHCGDVLKSDSRYTPSHEMRIFNGYEYTYCSELCIDFAEIAYWHARTEMKGDIEICQTDIWEIETKEETLIVPCDEVYLWEYIRDMEESRILCITTLYQKWCYRWIRPGYLDSSDLSYADTEQEAIASAENDFSVEYVHGTWYEQE